MEGGSGVKRIVNLHEEAAYNWLLEVCTQYGATGHANTGIASMLPIKNSGIEQEVYRQP